MESFRKFVCEFLGTFALTFIGAGSIITSAWTAGHPGLIGIALAHGVILAIVISATMNISGGHINPAVTAGLFITGRIRAGSAIGYVISQCAGATVAGLVLVYVFRSLGASSVGVPGDSALRNCLVGTPNFAATVPPLTAVLVEAVLTFLLVFAVFGTAVDGRAPKIGGFGIGLTVAVDILAGGPITGGAMNPARTIGTLIAGGEITQSLWGQHWVYWVGPVLGGAIAAIIYDSLIIGRPARSPD